MEAQLAHSLIGAREQYEELRDVNAKNANWRRRQVELNAESEERDSELRELRRILNECEERRAVAKATLLSLLEK